MHGQATIMAQNQSTNSLFESLVPAVKATQNAVISVQSDGESPTTSSVISIKNVIPTIGMFMYH